MLRRYCSKLTKPKHSYNFIRYKSTTLDATRAELTPKELEQLLQPDEEEISNRSLLSFLHSRIRFLKAST